MRSTGTQGNDSNEPWCTIPYYSQPNDMHQEHVQGMILYVHPEKNSEKGGQKKNGRKNNGIKGKTKLKLTHMRSRATVRYSHSEDI